MNLSLTGVTVGYRGKAVCRNVTVSVPSGIVAVLGANGAGKTTLLRAVANPTLLHAGEICLGESVFSGGGAARRAYFAQSGYLPQHWNFFPRFTALETLQYMAWLKGVPKVQRVAAAENALEQVGLAAQRNVLVGRLSGGMQRRLAFAEAIVHEPKLLILDEPTVGLDMGQRKNFHRLVREHASTNRVTLLSTHLAEDVAGVADRVIIMAAGAVVFAGTVAQLAELGGGSSEEPAALERGYLTTLHAKKAA